MKSKTNKILKYLIFILFIILAIIVLVILFFKTKNDSENMSEFQVANTIDDEYELDNNMPDEELNDINTSTNTVTDEDEEEKSLKIVTNTQTYFLVKQCMESYYANYNSEHYLEDETENDNQIGLIDLIDFEARQALNINTDNVNNLYGKTTDAQSFSIDKIYEQNLDNNKNLYVVYYRVQIGSKVQPLSLFVKIDTYSKRFSIYPYEYLKAYNYLELKDGDVVTINNLNEITANNANTYDTEEITTGNEACVKELFKKYKFDLQLDLQNLYNHLEEEYKNARFGNYNNFVQYVNENKTDLYLDTLERYKSYSFSKYVELMGISFNKNYYIFNATSLTDYSIILDNYTTVLPQYIELYKGNFPSVQAKFCVQRFMKAINNKDYNFAYSKLVSVLKNNYYPSIDDFINKIQNNLFEKNRYEFDDGFAVTDNVYQYNVKVYDEENEFNEAKTITATVTLLDDNANFNIAFVIE